MRWWNEAVATAADLMPGGVLGLAVIGFGLAVLTALGLYYWPAWLPSRWPRRGGARSGRARLRIGLPRLRWPRLAGPRWRRRRWRRSGRRGRRPLLDELPPDELPEMPAAVLALTADELAAAGRYAEAVRERLRAIVRDLVERGVIPHTPGWTVTELAAAAGRARPPLAPILGAAAGLFSGIWYGQRPATAADDAAMRDHAGQVRSRLAEPTSVPA